MIAMASDMRIGTPNAKTAFLFVRVGLAGLRHGRVHAAAAASSARVARRSCCTPAASMTAEEARAWGFFNRLVDSADVLAQAQALARALADGPTFAHAMTKKLLHQEWAMDLGDRDRGRSAGAGDLHADGGLPARL